MAEEAQTQTTEAPATETPQVPEWAQAMPKEVQQTVIAKGWDTPDKVIESYRNLETKLGQPKGGQSDPAAAPVTPEPSTDTLQVPNQAAETKRFLDRVGLSKDAVLEDFTKGSGKFSDEVSQKIAAAGYAVEDVQDYIQATAKAAKYEDLQRQSVFDKAHKLTGGKEQTQSVLNWAAQNLSQAEKDSINTALQGDSWELTFRGLYSRYAEATGADRGSTNEGGTPPPPSGTGVFRSKAEVVAALNNPKYGQDAAYTRDVDQRLAASPHVKELD